MDSFSPTEAAEGMNLYKVLTGTNAPPMALPSAMRRAGVSEHASSLFDTLRQALQPSPQEVARSMFRRTMCAHPLARVSVMQGLKLRTDLVAVRAVRRPVLPGVAPWPRAPEVRSYVVQVETRAGRAWRHPDSLSSPRRGRRRAGADNPRVSRFGRSSRPARKAGAQVRGGPTLSKSSDHWPGVKAAGRPARVLPVAEPQAEPCGNSSRAVTTFAVRFDGAPASPPGATVPRVQEHPTFVAQICRGCVAFSRPACPAPCIGYVVGIGTCVAARGASAVAGQAFEMGRRPYDPQLSLLWPAFSEVFAPL